MDQPNLKDRFNKIQTKLNPETNITEPQAVILEKENFELPRSKKPELQQMLRNASRGIALNWKTSFKSMNNHYKIVTIQSEEVIEIQRLIQAMADHPIIVGTSFTDTDEEDMGLVTELYEFIKNRADYFSLFFKEISYCMIRTHKGRPVFEFEGTRATTENFRSYLEKESINKKSNLRSYQFEIKDGWISVSLNISNELPRSFGEINV